MLEIELFSKLFNYIYEIDDKIALIINFSFKDFNLFSNTLFFFDLLN